MFDDLLAHIVGEAIFRRLDPSARTQLLVRVCFGLLGGALGIVGAIHFATRPGRITNVAMFASMISMFLCMAAFFLGNVALHRRWRWPALGFVASFVAMFASRIALGP